MVYQWPLTPDEDAELRRMVAINDEDLDDLDEEEEEEDEDEIPYDEDEPYFLRPCDWNE